MEAIILAGGLGTRLRQTLPHLPKAMAPIQGRPFLEFVLWKLSNSGFSHVILSLGYMADVISAHFGTSYLGMHITNVIENAPLGTGGAIRLALEKSEDDHVYILNGDTFLDLEYLSLEADWQTHKSIVIVGRETEEASRYGTLSIINERVIGFNEKGGIGKGKINAGCYILPRGVMEEVPLCAELSFEKDYLTHEVKKRIIHYHQTDCYFIDIGVPEDYVRAQFEMPKLIKLSGNIFEE